MHTQMSLYFIYYAFIHFFRQSCQNILEGIVLSYRWGHLLISFTENFKSLSKIGKGHLSNPAEGRIRTAPAWIYPTCC